MSVLDDVQGLMNAGFDKAKIMNANYDGMASMLRQTAEEGFGRQLSRINLKVKRLSDTAKLPENRWPDAGWDLFADENKKIEAGVGKLVDTGISVSIPEGHVGIIFDRSSYPTNRGLERAAGVIDSGYTGPVKVFLRNCAGLWTEVVPGDKIAQLVILPTPRVTLVEVDSLDETERSDGGFGSTGE